MNTHRVLVLARAGAARERTEAALRQADAALAAVLDPATADEAQIRAVAPDAVLVVLDPVAEAALEGMDSSPEIKMDARWNEFDHEQMIVRHKPRYRSKTVMVADLARKGDPRHQFQLLFDAALERWTAGEDDGYAETFEQFTTRANAGMSELAEGCEGAENVLVFTSGGPVSAVAAELLGLDAAEHRDYRGRKR